MGKAEAARSRQQRIARTLAANRRAARRRRILTWTAVAAVAVAAILGVATLVALQDGKQASASGTGRLGPEGIPLQTGAPLAAVSGAAGGQPVDGIRCDASEHVDYHIHAHLAVFADGVPRRIPYGIGVVRPSVSRTARGPFVQATRCYYWLHTHTTDGVIHVESPSQRQYTLGDFFDIWRQPLGAARVGPARGTVTAYVDGTKVTGDPRRIVLREHEDIQLDVGTPVVPPHRVDWSTAQL